MARGTPPASWVCRLWLGGRDRQGGDICLTLLSASVTWCVFSQELITLQHVLINIWSWSGVETEQNAKRMEVWSGEAQKGLAVKNGGWSWGPQSGDSLACSAPFSFSLYSLLRLAAGNPDRVPEAVLSCRRGVGFRLRQLWV